MARDLAAARAAVGGIRATAEAISILSEFALEAGDLVPRLLAIQLIGAIPHELATSALIGIASDPEIPLRARTQAVIALTEQPGDSANRALGQLLGSRETEVRIAAARALGLVGSPQSVRPLEQLLHGEAHTAVRRVAFEALGQIGSDEALDVLFGLLDRGDAAAVMDRAHLLDAIASMSSSSAVPGLLDHLRRSAADDVRSAVVSALAQGGDSRAFDALVSALEVSGPSDLRLDAIDGLGLIGDPRALPMLNEISRAGIEAERRASAIAIRRIHETDSKGGSSRQP